MKHSVRDEGVAGSNPATPTKFLITAITTGPDMGNETHPPTGLSRYWKPDRLIAAVGWRAVASEVAPLSGAQRHDRRNVANTE
jgi:hypothetical protein